MNMKEISNILFRHFNSCRVIKYQLLILMGNISGKQIRCMFNPYVTNELLQAYDLDESILAHMSRRLTR